MRSAHRVSAAFGILTVLLVLGMLVEVAWPQTPTLSRARIAVIETTAPLQDRSEQSIETALTEALETALRGATAMGLPWFQIRQALVLAGMVTVQIFATDTEPEGAEQLEPGARFGHPARTDL